MQKDQLVVHVYLIYGNFHTLEPIFTHKNHFHLPYNLQLTYILGMNR